MKMLKKSLFATSRLLLCCAILVMLPNCAKSKQNQWDDIDYSKVRGRDTYENDGNYRLPSVSSCTDDDLFNCN